MSRHKRLFRRKIGYQIFWRNVLFLDYFHNVPVFRLFFRQLHISRVHVKTYSVDIAVKMLFYEMPRDRAAPFQVRSLQKKYPK